MISGAARNSVSNKGVFLQSGRFGRQKWIGQIGGESAKLLPYFGTY